MLTIQNNGGMLQTFKQGNEWRFVIISFQYLAKRCLESLVYKHNSQYSNNHAQRTFWSSAAAIVNVKVHAAEKYKEDVTT